MVHDLIACECHEEFKYAYMFGFKLTPSVLKEIRYCVNTDEMMKIPEDFRIVGKDTYSILGLKVSRLALAFKAMKRPLPQKERVMYSIFEKNLRQSKFCPYHVVVSHNDVDVLEWMIKRRPIHKDELRHYAEEKEADRILAWLDK